MFKIFENPVRTAIQLLKCLHVEATSSHVNNALKNHPNYPSLLSISDLLTSLKVDNVSIQTSAEKLNEIPLPFVSLLKEKNNFITVIGISENTVSYHLNSKIPIKENKTNFLLKWSETALLAKAGPDSGETCFAINRRKEIWRQMAIPFLLLLAFGCIIFTAVMKSPTDFSYSLPALMCIFILKSTGIIVSCVLLWYEVDKTNPALEKICSTNRKVDCNAILSSEASKVFGGILSWSDIGLVYFAGGFLFCILGQHKENVLVLLAWINVLALPYTFFSIYYQWRVAKQWCILCLIVQALLVAELTINMVTAVPFTLHAIELPELGFIMAFSYLLPFFCWYAVKPTFLSLQEAKSQRNKLIRFKYDNVFFKSVLSAQRKISVPDADLGITIGNPDALHTIIKVCNPFCQPCAKAHPEIEKLIQTNKNIKAQIIFTSSTDINDKRNKPISHFLSIADIGNELLTIKSLNDWYLLKKKDYAFFEREHPVDHLSDTTDKLKAMREWCINTEIKFTPTIFIDGQQLPNLYEISDLQYLLS